MRRARHALAAVLAATCVLGCARAATVPQVPHSPLLPDVEGGAVAPPVAARPWWKPRAEVGWDHGIRYGFLDEPEIVLGEGWPAVHLGEQPLIDGRIGFKLHVDGAGFVERGGIDPIDAAVDVRRAFLTSSGVIRLLHPVQYNLEFGVLKDRFYLDSAWINVREIPGVRTVKIGAFDAPIGFDNLVSSRDRTFMEVAAPIQAFVPDTAPGIQLRRSFRDDRITGALGWFSVGQRREVGDRSRALSRFVGRMTWLARDVEPPAAAREAELVHLGLAASYVFAGGSGEIRYLAKPESFLAPVAVDTGPLDGKHAIVIGAELAARRGPLSFQGEFLHAFVDGSPNGAFPGLYAGAAFLLTGETRPWGKETAVFGQVVPERPFDPRPRRWRRFPTAYGAVEVAGRYSWVDLDDGQVEGGTMHVLTAGLNWYWNRWIRWQLDSEHAFVDGGPLDGRLHTLQARFQLVL